MGGLTKAFIGGYNQNVIDLALAAHNHTEYATTNHTHTASQISGLSSYTIITSTSTDAIMIEKAPIFTIATFMATTNNYARPGTLILLGTGSKSFTLDWNSSPKATLTVTTTKITITKSNCNFNCLISVFD